MKPKQEPPETRTPIEETWGTHLAVRPSNECLEADLLIELTERGRSSPRWNAGMDHIVRCASCRERYRETLLLTQMSPRQPGFHPANVAATLSAGLRLPDLRQSFAPFVVGAVAAGTLVWLLGVVPLQRAMGTANAEADALRISLSEQTKQIEAATQMANELREELRERESVVAAVRPVTPRPVNPEIPLKPKPARLAVPKTPETRVAIAKPSPLPSPVPRSTPGLPPINLDGVRLPSLTHLASYPADDRTRGAGDPTPEPTAAPIPIELLAPVAVRVPQQGLVLRWKSSGNEAVYRVQVFEADTNRILYSSKTRETELPVPILLPAGKMLQWSIARIEGEREIGRSENAFVETLSEADAARLEAELRKAGTDTLRQAAALAGAGMLEEANRRLDSYLSGKPGDAAARRFQIRLQDAMRTAWIPALPPPSESAP